MSAEKHALWTAVWVLSLLMIQGIGSALLGCHAFAQQQPPHASQVDSSRADARQSGSPSESTAVDIVMILKGLTPGTRLRVEADEFALCGRFVSCSEKSLCLRVAEADQRIDTAVIDRVWSIHDHSRRNGIVYGTVGALIGGGTVLVVAANNAFAMESEQPDDSTFADYVQIGLLGAGVGAGVALILAAVVTHVTTSTEQVYP